MSECTDKKMHELLHAFELNLLTDDLRDQVEKHLLECDACYQEVTGREAVTKLLEADSDVRQLAGSLAQEPETQPLRPHVRITSWRLWAPLAAAAVLVLMLILKDWEFRSSAPAIAGENAVVVVPFVDQQPAADSLPAGELISSLIVGNLSQSKALSVVSAQYVYDLSRQTGSGQQPTNQEIAQRAHAQWLVQGSVTHIPPRTVVTAEIIEVSSGKVKAAPLVEDTGRSAVFGIVDRIAQKIRESILKPPDLSKEPTRSIAEMTTESPMAYQEYLRGLDLYRRYSLDEAEPHFRLAVKYDSTFAMPYYYLAGIVNRREAGSMIEKASRYSDRLSERDRLFIQVRAAAVTGHYSLVPELLRGIVDRYKDEKEPLLQLAQVEYNRNQLPQSIEHVNKAIALDSQYSDAFNQLAYCYSRIGDFDRALQAINRCVALSPDEPNPYDSRGELYADFGHFDEAVASYHQALAVDPKFVATQTKLGYMYLLQSDFTRADSCFQSMTTSDIAVIRSSGRTCLALSNAYQGRFAQALQQISDGLPTDSVENLRGQAADKFNLRSQMYDVMGRYTEALASARACVENGGSDRRDPSRRVSYLVYLLALTGHSEEARTIVTRVYTMLDTTGSPMNAYYSALGSLALGESRPDSALTCFERAVIESDNFFDRIQFAKLCLERGRLADAVTAFQKAAGTYSSHRMWWSLESARLHYYLAKAYEQSRWYPQAIAEYRAFLTLWRDADSHIREVADARRHLQALEQKS